MPPAKSVHVSAGELRVFLAVCIACYRGRPKAIALLSWSHAGIARSQGHNLSRSLLGAFHMPLLIMGLLQYRQARKCADHDYA